MKKVLLFFLLLVVVGISAAWLRYGGGDRYPDLTTAPVFKSDRLETVVAYSEPIGSVALSPGGRLFFTVHPEARPRGNRLLEFVEGASVPFPSSQSQQDLFDTVLGLTVDSKNRLWTIDHGNHGLRDARILAIDLDSGDVIRNQVLPARLAPAGSYLKDIEVSDDGRTVIIADTSLWRLSPAIIVYDVETGDARRVLESHDSVRAGNYRIGTATREMSFLGGIVSLKGGVNNLALGPEWLYYGALTGAGLHRVRLRDLTDESLGPQELASRVEQYSAKPLSDGFEIDVNGNVYVTDVEHSAVSVVGSDRRPRTLVRDERIRWAGGVSLGPQGSLYIADSGLPDFILQPHEHITANKPYRVFRIRTHSSDVPQTDTLESDQN